LLGVQVIEISHDDVSPRSRIMLEQRRDL